MKIKTLMIGLTMSLAAVACSIASDEQTLRDLDAQWSAAAAAKDLDKTVSFYSDDATVLAPNNAMLTTRDGIRKLWKDLFATPGVAVSWKVTKVEMSKSGDMAYIAGTYEMAMNDASGKPASDHGKYLEVWEKQADGKWKCGADAFNTDLPLPSSGTK
jgi:uncharacterized protein (TIGR02246 family)